MTRRKTILLIAMIAVAIISMITLTLPVNIASAAQNETKILFIGNSWSNRSAKYLHAVAKSAGQDTIVSVAKLSGGSLQEHYFAAKYGGGRTWYYHTSKTMKRTVRSNISYIKYDGSNTPTTKTSTLLKTVRDKDWDYIILQNRAPENGIYDVWDKTASGNADYCIGKDGKKHKFDVNYFVDWIKSNMNGNTGKKTKIGLDAMWTYPHGQDNPADSIYRFAKLENNGKTPSTKSKWSSLYNLLHTKIQSTIPKIKAHMGSNCDFILNPGMTMYNARRDKTLRRFGYRLNVSSTNSHQAYGLPCYLTSLNYAYSLLGISRDAVSWYPTTATDSYVPYDGLDASKKTVKSYKMTLTDATIARRIAYSTKTSVPQKWCSDTLSADSGKPFIITANGNKVLDVSGGSKKSGANVQIWESNLSTAQRWIVSFKKVAENNGYYLIRNAGSKMYLSESNIGNGSNVLVSSSASSDASKWRITRNNRSYTITNIASGRSLDVSGANFSNGTNIQVWNDNSTSAQRFAFDSPQSPVKNGSILTIFSSGNSSYAIDVSNASRSNGANIQTWTSNGTNAQKFRFNIDTQTGYYRITNIGSGKVLDVSNGSRNAGANVWQWENNGTFAQRWSISRSGSLYTIRNADTGLALDISGGNPSNGENIQVWDPNGTKAQKWYLR